MSLSFTLHFIIVSVIGDAPNMGRIALIAALRVIFQTVKTSEIVIFANLFPYNCCFQNK